MPQTIRVGNVSVTTFPDLSTHYRLAINITPEHSQLFQGDERKYINSFIRNNKIRYQFVLESYDKEQIIRKEAAAQLIVNSAKLKALMEKQQYLINKVKNK